MDFQMPRRSVKAGPSIESKEPCGAQRGSAMVLSQFKVSHSRSRSVRTASDVTFVTVTILLRG